MSSGCGFFFTCWWKHWFLLLDVVSFTCWWKYSIDARTSVYFRSPWCFIQHCSLIMPAKMTLLRPQRMATAIARTTCWVHDGPSIYDMCRSKTHTGAINHESSCFLNRHLYWLAKKKKKNNWIRSHSLYRKQANKPFDHDIPRLVYANQRPNGCDMEVVFRRCKALEA